mmetsp:Transcript_1575/g.4293  ORF Transcript_1575/g.4293 Transcript_1575/m.4293 type:complete len:256 (+) Transcript_1575:509-1276(+)
MSARGGWRRTPPWAGQRPARTRKSADLPDPTDPVMRSPCPGDALNVTPWDKHTPVGVTTSTPLISTAAPCVSSPSPASARGPVRSSSSRTSCSSTIRVAVSSRVRRLSHTLLRRPNEYTTRSVPARTYSPRAAAPASWAAAGSGAIAATRNPTARPGMLTGPLPPSPPGRLSARKRKVRAAVCRRAARARAASRSSASLAMPSSRASPPKKEILSAWAEIRACVKRNRLSASRSMRSGVLWSGARIRRMVHAPTM